MPLPLAALVAMAAGANVLGSAGKSLSERSARKSQEKEAEKDRQLRRDEGQRDAALEESMADPFRHTLAQLQAASLSDQLANTRPRTVSIPGLRPEFTPKLGGGYQASDEMRAAGNSARSAILGGQGTAPSMTDPKNYGQTNLLNLLAMLSGGGAGGGAAAPGGPSGARTNFGMPQPLPPGGASSPLLQRPGWIDPRSAGGVSMADGGAPVYAPGGMSNPVARSRPSSPRAPGVPPMDEDDDLVSSLLRTAR